MNLNTSLSLTHFLFKRLEECTFYSLGVKGLILSPVILTADASDVLHIHVCVKDDTDGDKQGEIYIFR